MLLAWNGCAGDCSKLFELTEVKYQGMLFMPDNVEYFSDPMVPLNSLTAIGPYMAHRFSWASFKLNNYSNVCPLIMFDSSKCSQALQLK
jgi:hypothetical protein